MSCAEFRIEGEGMNSVTSCRMNDITVMAARPHQAVVVVLLFPRVGVIQIIVLGTLEECVDLLPQVSAKGFLSVENLSDLVTLVRRSS
jgi:hypothetical protein